MPNACLRDVKRSKVVSDAEDSLAWSLPGNHSPFPPFSYAKDPSLPFLLLLLLIFLFLRLFFDCPLFSTAPFYTEVILTFSSSVEPCGPFLCPH